MGLTFNNNNKRQRIIKDNPSDKLSISINRNTNTPACRRKQISGSTVFLCNQWNLLNTHRHTVQLRHNLEKFLNNNNNKHVINSQKISTTIAQTQKWYIDRQITQDKVNLPIKIRNLKIQNQKLTPYSGMLRKKLHQTAIPKE